MMWLDTQALELDNLGSSLGFSVYLLSDILTV